MSGNCKNIKQAFSKGLIIQKALAGLAQLSAPFFHFGKVVREDEQNHE
jgi:hypothetical protein